MKSAVLFSLFLLFFAGHAVAEAPVSEDTETCLGCHESIHPGIVEDWKKSRHALTTPGAAMKVKGPGLKVSSEKVPGGLMGVSVGCAECHTLRPKAHADTFDHNDYDVHVVVSPDDCAACHAQERAQYERNVMSRAHGNLNGNKVYGLLKRSINGTPALKNGKLVLTEPEPGLLAESCEYCHGTKLSVRAMVTRDTDLGEMEFPDIEGWPNQGTGRVNLDGSLGACTACHPRHRFSMAMARKPYTCKECHAGPDVPAYKVYAASKHGNIFSSKQKEWDFTPVPWTVGRDFTAPTCAACHMSQLADTDGQVITERTHEIKDRLAYRLFGLIYAHPHPRDADTSIIRNGQGLQLPTDFQGRAAEGFLLDGKERDQKREAMQASCLACHDSSWVNRHWQRMEETIRETNAATLTATQLMQEIWTQGGAQGLIAGGNPFDEFIERKWCNTWLFYANSIRLSSAMGGGGDYGVFANGRYFMSQTIQEIYDRARRNNSGKSK
jgi:hydroxylamine dehydrogenase